MGSHGAAECSLCVCGCVGVSCPRDSRPTFSGLLVWSVDVGKGEGGLGIRIPGCTRDARAQQIRELDMIPAHGTDGVLSVLH